MRSDSTSARLSARIQEASRRITTLCMSNSIQDGTCFENKNVFLTEETSPYAANFHSEGIQKLQRHLPGNPHDSPFGQATSHPVRNLNYSKIGLWRDGAKRTRPGVRMDLELLLEPCPLRDTAFLPKPAHDILHVTANAKLYSRCNPYRCTRQASEDFESLRRRHKIPPKVLCSIRTVDHGSPETKSRRPCELEACVKELR